jgi:hypothetical protein
VFFNNDFLSKGEEEVVLQDEGGGSEENIWVLINVIELKMINYFSYLWVIFRIAQPSRAISTGESRLKYVRNSGSINNIMKLYNNEIYEIPKRLKCVYYSQFNKVGSH